MYRKYVYKGITWFDFRETGESEIIDVAKLYSLSQRAIKHLLSDEENNSVTHDEDVLLLRVSVPCSINLSRDKRISQRTINFVIGNEFIISSRYKDIRGFVEAKRLLKNKPNQKWDMSLHVLGIVFKEIYSHLRNDVALDLEEIASTHHIYALKKYMKDYERSIKKHKRLLEVFSAIAIDFFEHPMTRNQLDEIMQEYHSLQSLVSDKYSSVKSQQRGLRKQIKRTLLEKILGK